MRLSMTFALALMAAMTQAPAQAAQPKQPNNWTINGPRGTGKLLFTAPTHWKKESGWLWKKMYWIDLRRGRHLVLSGEIIEESGTVETRKYYVYSVVGAAANDRAQCGFVDLSNGCIGVHMDVLCEGQWDEHSDNWVQPDGTTNPPLVGGEDYAKNILDLRLLEDRYHAGIKINDQVYFDDPFSGVANMLRCDAISQDNMDTYKSILDAFKKNPAPKAARYLQKAINDYTKKKPRTATSP